MLCEQGRGEGKFGPLDPRRAVESLVLGEPRLQTGLRLVQPAGHIQWQALQCATAPRVGEPDDDVRAAQRLRHLQHDGGELGPLRA